MTCANSRPKVTFFITPKSDQKNPETFFVPAVKFVWGAFSFVGVMESMEETLELFSNDGRPLRATVTFGLTQQSIIAFQQGSRLPSTGRAAGGKPTGTVPLTAAPAGANVQGLAALGSAGTPWQDIATANGVENPRFLEPGELLNINASFGP